MPPAATAEGRGELHEPLFRVSFVLIRWVFIFRFQGLGMLASTLTQSRVNAWPNPTSYGYPYTVGAGKRPPKSEMPRP